jgi:hypothetical protein
VDIVDFENSARAERNYSNVASKEYYVPIRSRIPWQLWITAWATATARPQLAARIRKRNGDGA